MSFLSQKMANNFPRWSTIRRDQSSNGQKIFSLFGDLFESKYVDILKVAESFKINKYDLGVHKVYEVDLKEEDYYIESEENDVIYTFPTVKALIDGSQIELERITGSENFLFGLPNTYKKEKEIEYSSDLIFTRDKNGNETIDTSEFDFNERLYIKVFDSTLYKNLSNLAERNKPYGGFSFVTIQGKDEYYNDIEEHIRVNRDGEYFTNQIFRKLDKVLIDGFNGKVEIRLSEARTANRDISTYVKTNKFNFTADNQRNGFSEISVSNKTINFFSGSESVYYLNLFSRFIANEYSVKQHATKDLGDALFVKTLLSEVVLWDKSKNNFLTPVDYFVSEINSRLYVLDSEGKVHIGDLTLRPFENTEHERDEEVSIVSFCGPQRPAYGSTINIRCEIRKTLFSISGWQIKIISPLNAVYLVKYSYDSATGTRSIDLLGPGQHNNSYKNPPLVPEERALSGVAEATWGNFSFDFVVDEIGQWDVITTAYYIDGSELTHKTSFMCDFWEASRVIDLKVDEKPPVGMFLSKENLLAVKFSNKIIFYDEVFYTYLADVINNRILCRSLFEEIEVTYDEI